MAKLYFRFGTMGCSKSAQALITKFNYEERNMKVMFIKPAIDTRDGADIVRSRIGLEAKAIPVPTDMNVYDLYKANHTDCQVVICDECQFLTKEQVIQLWRMSQININVMCFGLKTSFKNELFESIQTLMVYADKIKTIQPASGCQRCNDVATP